jgi:hypothetical protein
METAAQKTSDPHVETFLALSAVLTGFSPADLQGTGCVPVYFHETVGAAGKAVCDELWKVAHEILAGPPATREKAIRTRILADPKLGPVVRAVIKMWFLARWEQLSGAWRRNYGINANDVDHVISAEAYQQGLVWRTCGAHPHGAQPPGFASWSVPPVLPGQAGPAHEGHDHEL